MPLIPFFHAHAHAPVEHGQCQYRSSTLYAPPAEARAARSTPCVNQLRQSRSSSLPFVP